MNWRLILWLCGSVLGAVILAELLLSLATANDRWHLFLILAAPPLITAALVPLLRRWVSNHAGLGLAITRALVQQHNGRAWLGAGFGGDVHVCFSPKEQS